MASPSPTPSASGASRARGRCSIANALTLLRLLSAPICALAILGEASRPAFALFSLAALSDLADGRLARRMGQSSAFGALFDHATDALFVSLGLGALALRGEVPLLLPLFVMLSFIQYTLDSRALAGRPLRTSRLGRSNGILYYVLLGVPLGRDALRLAWPSTSLVAAAGWILLLATLVSMLDRALAWRLSRRVRGLPAE